MEQEGGGGKSEGEGGRRMEEEGGGGKSEGKGGGGLGEGTWATVLEGLMARTRSRSAVTWFVVWGLGFRVWGLGSGSKV